MISRRFPWAVFLVCITGGISTAATAWAADPTKKQCVAANESGQDLRSAGKLREARAALSVCMAARCPRPVREDCAQRLSEIEAALPTLVFVAKDGEGQDLSDVRVTMDGEPLGASDGTAIAVNPGDHTFTFTKDGMPAVENTLVVREGDKNRHVQVTLEPIQVTPEQETLPLAPALPPKAKSGILTPGTERALGIGIGVAGIGGVAVGAIFGFMAKATYDHAVGECPGGNTGICSEQGTTDSKTAKSQATVSTIAFIGGGALLAGGVVLYFATPSGSVTVSPTVANRGGGLGVSGRF